MLYNLLIYLNEVSELATQQVKHEASICWMWAPLSGFHELEDIWVTVKIVTKKIAIIGTTNLVFS